MVYERGALWVILSLRGHLGANQAVSQALLQIEEIIHFETRLVNIFCHVSKKKAFICDIFCQQVARNGLELKWWPQRRR